MARCRLSRIRHASAGGGSARPTMPAGAASITGPGTMVAASLLLWRRSVSGGGVLEHPAKSHAWATFFLTPPQSGGWLRCGAGEYVCEVWQSAYGHKAAKATWLFYCGPSPADARWGRIPGTHQVGFQDQRGKAANKPTLTKREANATPPEFARWLVELAASSRVEARRA